MGVQHQLLVGANWLGYSYDRYQASFETVYTKPETAFHYQAKSLIIRQLIHFLPMMHGDSTFRT